MRLRVDDPVGVVGVHWGCGVWSMLATGMFANVDDVARVEWAPEPGVFKGGHGNLLAVNVAMVLAVTVWSAGCTAIVVS